MGLWRDQSGVSRSSGPGSFYPPWYTRNTLCIYRDTILHRASSGVNPSPEDTSRNCNYDFGPRCHYGVSSPWQSVDTGRIGQGSHRWRDSPIHRSPIFIYIGVPGPTETDGSNRSDQTRGTYYGFHSGAGGSGCNLQCEMSSALWVTNK